MSWRREGVTEAETEQALIAHARDGDQRAFGTLCERYRARMVGYCRRFLPETSDPEGAAQEAFTSAYKHFNTFMGPETRFASWLFTIARHHCLNQVRGTQYTVVSIEPLAETLADSPTGPNSPSAQVEREAHVEELLTLILGKAKANGWDKDDYKIFATRYLQDDRTLKEVAAILQTSYKSVRYHFYEHVKPTLEAVGRRYGSL